MYNPPSPRLRRAGGGEKVDQKQIVNFLSFWVANTVALLISAAVLGGNVVLGNDKVSASVAAIIAGLILTVITTFTPRIVEKSGFKVKDDKLWGVIFLSVNFVGIWVIKRLAILTGLGISSILWVLILAVVITLVQWGVAQATGAMKSQGKFARK